jgi:oxygen-independent coproporphyrinogen-3 oxidase
MGYTTHARTDLIGLGVSAISRIGDSYAQSVRDLPSWEIAVDADRLPIWRGLRLSADDRVRADVIQQIMCSGEVDMRATGHRHQLDFGATFASELAQIAALQEEGLVELEPGWIRATPRGRLLLRVIAMCFDAYLGAPGTAPARFSAVL